MTDYRGHKFQIGFIVNFFHYKDPVPYQEQ